jgi:hypothetical protein
MEIYRGAKHEQHISYKIFPSLMQLIISHPSSSLNVSAYTAITMCLLFHIMCERDIS